MSDERIRGVNCSGMRFIYYAWAFFISFLSLQGAIIGMRLEKEYMIRYAIMCGVTVAYVGMLIRCLFKDVPVPKYRIGLEGRVGILWVLMIYIYLSTHYCHCKDKIVPVAIGHLVSVGGLSLMLLAWPAEDFNGLQIIVIIFVVNGFGILCYFQSFSVFIFIPILLFSSLLVTSECSPRRQVINL
ncbi:unnamed protein product [Eruca vesicaria subsp. sativa]|uniref:Uncharacterized protein n=1 Tax=Eruca vesicaria subsp. sativa TaxID=29727 RepID=A0ABC8JZ63_ERUVS|nr:unnamed protein product [Eruca vesicaria subsp. sativa]